MPRAGDAILLAAMALLSIGVVMVNSAGLSVSAEDGVTFASILFSRSSIYMALAVAALLIASRLPVADLLRTPRAVRWIPFLVPAALVALLLVYLPVIGHEVNGSRRWIRVPGLGLTVQPSEFAKWAMVVVVAWYCATRGHLLSTFRGGLLPILLALALVAAFVAKEDLGTGVLIAAAGTVILVAAGARLVHLLAMAPAALACVGVLVLSSPYRLQRLIAYADPYQDPDGTGYHIIQSMVAIANGRGFGRGLGFGLQKFGYLPEDRTDFLFAVVCEELGIAGATLVVALYFAILLAGWSIVRRQTNRLLMFIGLGVLATFGLQAMMNLLVVTGLAPTKGIALPLTSSGGTGWVLTAGALGLIVAMDRCTETASAPDTAEPTDTPDSPGAMAVA